MTAADPLEIRAFFHLATELGGGGRRSLAHEPGATVASVAAEIGIDAAAVGLVMVNGRKAELDDRLSPGDRVAYFPVYVPYHRVYGMCVL
ncbi:MAG TPA: thiamine S protein [Thermoleophilia bacterium]|nr:thiamine S protein [Thermoleophilia bacterium]